MRTRKIRSAVQSIQIPVPQFRIFNENFNDGKPVMKGISSQIIKI